MKKLVYILEIFLVSCTNEQTKNNPSQNDTAKNNPEFVVTDAADKYDICWSGTVNAKTPVFIHYQVSDQLIVGEITYLNTKEKKPIKIIGTIEEDKSYRILEFEPDGNISGIITGTPVERAFNGQWFSPKTRKELDLQLFRVDSLIQSRSIEADLKDVYGDYRYQYSEAGYQGAFNIDRVSDDRASFSISSVTGEPARNIADIGTDTIRLGATNFIYKVPETDSCEFKVSFFKGFAYVNYTIGNCDGQFGHNATIEGIFLKMK